jgi:hypothetical protein
MTSANNSINSTTTVQIVHMTHSRPVVNKPQPSLTSSQNLPADLLFSLSVSINDATSCVHSAVTDEWMDAYAALVK